MTKENSSLIAVVMDRSGSMVAMRDETINGFNHFLEDQKKQPGECKLYYTQFDNEYEIVHDFIDIQAMEPLTYATYEPRGMTALLDAIGVTITAVGKRLSSMPEDERPSTVIFVIQTDGQENASKEFDLPTIQKMIKEQGEKYNWQFVWLAAGEDALNQFAKLGADWGQTMSYNSSDASNVAAYAAMSSNVLHARTTGSTRTFTDEEREEAAQTE